MGKISPDAGGATDDTPPKPKPRPKGLFCPNCRGVRLVVTTVRRVCPGKTVRYRRCSACGERVITEETVARSRSPKASS